MSAHPTLIYQQVITDTHDVDTYEKLYILTDSELNIVRYALILLGPVDTSKHLTAYLNLPKDEWLLVDDLVRTIHDITFEGVESQRISVKKSVDKIVPVSLYPFWVGIDFLGREAPEDWDAALAEIQRVCDTVNAELINAEIEKANAKIK